MQFRPTYFDDRRGSVGAVRGDRWVYEDLAIPYYHQPHYPHPLFEPQLAATLPPPSTTAMTGFNPNAPSPTRQYLLSPITPSTSSFAPGSPPPMRPASPIYSVPPSLISDCSSAPLSPILSYYHDAEAYPSPGLSLVGNSLVGYGCDSPVSDSLDYDAPFNISKSWGGVSMASLKLQDAVGSTRLPGSYQGWVQHVPRAVPSTPPTATTPVFHPAPAPLRAVTHIWESSWRQSVPQVALQTITEDEPVESARAQRDATPVARQLGSPFAIPHKPLTPSHTPKTPTTPISPPPPYSAGSTSSTPSESPALSTFFGRFEERCSIVDSSGKTHDLAPGLTPPAFEFDLAMREWICYRRNYISLSVAVSCPPNPRTKVFTSDPSKVAHSSPIASFRVTIDTRSQPSSASVELLQFDPSRKLRLARTVDPLLVHLGAASRARPAFATHSPTSYSPSFGIPHDRRASVAFNRLQYRSATANNGKQSHTQEHYVAIVRLDAVRDDQTIDEVGRWTSKPFIVRGRSPKNFTAAAGAKRRKEARAGRVTGSSARSGAAKRKRVESDWSDDEDLIPPVLRHAKALSPELGVGRSKRVRKSAEQASAKLKLEVETDSDADFELDNLKEDDGDFDDLYSDA